MIRMDHVGRALIQTDSCSSVHVKLTHMRMRRYLSLATHVHVQCIGHMSSDCESEIRSANEVQPTTLFVIFSFVQMEFTFAYNSLPPTHCGSKSFSFRPAAGIFHRISSSSKIWTRVPGRIVRSVLIALCLRLTH